MKIQQIMMRSENRLRIDFSDLIAMLDETQPMLTLHIMIHAISMNDHFTNESA